MAENDKDLKPEINPMANNISSPETAPAKAKTDEKSARISKKEQYKVLKFLGDGSYASVYEAMYIPTGNVF